MRSVCPSKSQPNCQRASNHQHLKAVQEKALLSSESSTKAQDWPLPAGKERQTCYPVILPPSSPKTEQVVPSPTLSQGAQLQAEASLQASSSPSLGTACAHGMPQAGTQRSHSPSVVHLARPAPSLNISRPGDAGHLEVGHQSEISTPARHGPLATVTAVTLEKPLSSTELHWGHHLPIPLTRVEGQLQFPEALPHSSMPPPGTSKEKNHREDPRNPTSQWDTTTYSYFQCLSELMQSI